MDRHLCIHGHFYQPPRENPWLEEVEMHDSAYPYHDWNERITAECYAPNAASRILDADRRIIDIVNNYSKISFNFGPTLLSWMERHTPDVHLAIIEADIQSRENFSGHGSAIAQVYNHMIIPLANGRDKRTQVIWGVKDFQYRFGRKPEGMWLPESAVDTDPWRPWPRQGSASLYSRRGRPGASGNYRAAAGAVPARGGSIPNAVPMPAAFGQGDKPLLLRRPDLAGHRFRGVAQQRRSVRLAAAFGIHRGRAPPARAHRDRRRDLRPSSSTRRHGAGIRHASHRVEQPRAHNELRRVSRKAPADA